MRIRSIAAALAMIIAICTAQALADDTQVRKELAALFNQFSAAFKNKDSKAALSFFAPDFTAKERGRTVTRAQVEEQMAQAMANLKSIESMTWDIQKLNVKGNQATVEARETLSATIVDTMGQLGPKGATHKLRDVERTRDLFVKTARGWLLKRSETLSAEITIDGKKLTTPPSG